MSIVQEEEILTLNKSACFAQMVPYSHVLCCFGSFRLKRAWPYSS